MADYVSIDYLKSLCEYYEFEDVVDPIEVIKYALHHLSNAKRELEWRKHISNLSNTAVPCIDALTTALPSSDILHADFAHESDSTGYSDDTAVRIKPDGNCLTCKYQYYDNMRDYCAICSGNPENI